MLLLALALACNDYDFKSGADAAGADTGLPDAPDDRGGGTDGGTTNGGTTDGGTTDGGTTDGGTTDGGTDTDTGLPDEPPEELIPDCDPGATATMSPGEIYVTSWDQPSATATLSADQAGFYHIYDYSIAESGASQRNETAYLRVTNGTRPEGEPVYANCGYEWLVRDADNDGPLPEGSRIYIGTFYLEAGDNTLNLYHYCPLYRAGECPSFQDSSTDDTCDGSGANSVHILAEGLCLVKALP